MPVLRIYVNGKPLTLGAPSEHLPGEERDGIYIYRQPKKGSVWQHQRLSHGEVRVYSNDDIRAYIDSGKLAELLKD